MDNIKIFYGIEDEYRDVTDLVFRYLTIIFGNSLIINIPCGDVLRGSFFGDHLNGIVKNIKIIQSDIKIILDDELYILQIDDITEENILYILNLRKEYHGSRDLEEIHRNLRFHGGDIKEEYPEQMMATRFINPDDCVLELGSNIGRNTLIISCLLNKSSNLVTLECDPDTCRTLAINRDLNNYKFNIESSALSSRKLIQSGWNTIPSDELLPGYTPVNTITYKELIDKYNSKIDHPFNILVADCEGALYYILQDFPDLLNNIDKILMENDYEDIEHKLLVNNILRNKGFRRIYHEVGGWGPCYDFFFEAWQRQELDLQEPQGPQGIEEDLF